MSSKILLRIASGLMIFHTIGHTFGHSSWKKTQDPIKQKVIQQMTDNEFPFMGETRSMSDYYEGYGLAVIISLLLFGILLWMLAGKIEENKDIIRPLLIVIDVSLMLWSLIEFLFFFPFAAFTTLLAAVLTFIVVLKLLKKQSSI